MVGEYYQLRFAVYMLDPVPLPPVRRPLVVPNPQESGGPDHYGTVQSFRVVPVGDHDLCAQIRVLRDGTSGAIGSKVTVVAVLNFARNEAFVQPQAFYVREFFINIVRNKALGRFPF